MAERRLINREQIHARAVIIGRARNFPAEAGRLAASHVGKAVDSLLDRLKPGAWALEDAAIIDAVAQRLWLEWVLVEYRSVARLEPR